MDFIKTQDLCNQAHDIIVTPEDVEFVKVFSQFKGWTVPE
jgi:hypothetical protein